MAKAGENVALREKLSLSIGLAGQNALYGFVGAYFMFYLTDILGIGMAAAGIILTIATIFDAINDPVMGLIADRTRTRWGKFRPYLVVGPTLLALVTVLMFTKIDLSATGLIVMACVGYVLFDLAYTLCDIPIWALTSVMHKDPKVRTGVITWANFGATAGSVFITVLGIQILNAFGGEREPIAFILTALVIGIAAALFMTATGLFTKERITPDLNEKPISFKKNFQTIYKNKPLLILVMSILCVVLTINVRGVIQMYYAVYVVEDTNFMTYAGLALVIGIVIGLSITPMLIKKFYKKYIFIAACIFNVIMSLIPYFLGYQYMWINVGLLGIGFISTGMFNSLMPTLLMDCIDYADWKLGFRGEGIVFSTRTFISKLCASIARGGVGLSLAALGYISGVKQTPYVIEGLHAFMFLIPAILIALAIIPMAFYPFTEDKRDEILAKLNERNEAKS
ncbi:MAG: glycoside-pentoside-hexuronide (GPH):cation symporter [Oscillospiraceae bacterium]|jgi:sugar (glycoside-pentoside-hexuronide) transporter|nr:glycoside-pentoside-hexuronide (GPH):cation symporter [Oscillospiraceae bacterium]